MRLEQRIRKWLAGGVTAEQIAAHLRISRAEVRDLARESRTWAPNPDQIRAACAEIRAGWSESDWAAAAALKR
jgi:hypothetical protein